MKPTGYANETLPVAQFISAHPRTKAESSSPTVALFISSSEQITVQTAPGQHFTLCTKRREQEMPKLETDWKTRVTNTTINILIQQVIDQVR